MYIDLSVTVNERTPVYPGDSPVEVKAAGEIEHDGFNDHVISINTHVGTHIDAPLHMLAGGRALDLTPVERFVGTGKLVSLGKESGLKDLLLADIQEGDIVLFRTDMSKHYHDTIYFEEYPTLSEEMAQYLVGRKVKMVGVDAGSVDIAEGFPIHKILLAGDVLIIENLTNLEALEGEEFTVYALPVKLDVDGAPARVIAQTN
jgi:arylformamidase